MCGSDITYQPPATVDYGESMRDGLQAQVDLAPALFRAEADSATGRKAYARLNQEILNESLLGRKVTYDSEGRIVKGFKSDSSKYEIISEPTLKTEVLKGNKINSSNSHQSLSREEMVSNFVVYDQESGEKVGSYETSEEALKEVRVLGGTGYSPIYEEDGNGNVVKDLTQAGKTTYTGGGMVSNIGGDQEREFIEADGTKNTRKAGFDKDGNFAGVSALARDLQQLDTAQRFTGELKAIEENADQFTQAYRSQGNIKGALAKVQQLSDVSSTPANISARGNSLTDIAKSFNAPQIGVGQQSSQQAMGGQQQDPNRIAGDPQVAQGSGMASGMGGQQQEMPNDTVYQDGVAGRIDPNTGAFMAFAQDDRPMSPPTAEDKTASTTIDPNQGATGGGAQRLGEDQRSQSLTTSTRRRGNTYITEIRDVQGNLVEQHSSDNYQDALAWGEKNIERVKAERDYNSQQEALASNNLKSEQAGQQQASELLQSATGNQQQQVSGQGALPTVSAEGVGDMGGLRSSMLTQAKEDLALGGDLSDRELRNAQQQARMASTARGRERDTSSILSELQNNEMASRTRQAERRGFASQVYGMEGQIGTADAQLQLQAEMANQQTSLAAQSANQQARMQQQSQLLDAAKADIDRGVAVDQMNTQYQMAGLAQDRGAAAQMVGLEQATSIDPTQAMFGRPSGAGTIAGQNLYGNAASNNQMPMLYNPSQGAEFAANQAAGLNSYNAAYMGAQAQVSAGKSAMFGSILGGIAQGAGTAYACWVAREVYGSHNPRWVMFRSWMLEESPSWFRILYLNFGEKFARFISGKPRLKARIRKWMDSKINRSV